MEKRLAVKPSFVGGGWYGHFRVQFFGCKTMIQALAEIETLVQQEIVSVKTMEAFDLNPVKHVEFRDGRIIRILGTNPSAFSDSFWLFLDKDVWHELKNRAEKMFP